MPPTDRPPKPQPLRCGDTREDGYRFISWRWRRGKWIPNWLRPEVFVKTKESNAVTTFNRRQTDPRTGLLKGAKSRAKQKGLPFNLSLDDIVIPPVCPALGIPLRPGHGPKSMHDGSPQLDRIIPKLGYVRGNVAVISKLANSIKCNALPDQVISVGEWYKRILREASS